MINVSKAAQVVAKTVTAPVKKEAATVAKAAVATAHSLPANAGKKLNIKA